MSIIHQSKGDSQVCVAVAMLLLLHHQNVETLSS